MNQKSFKTFLEEEEKSSFIGSLEDELGITTDDLSKEPQIASFFSLGKVINNLGPYKILRFLKNEKGKVTHAVVLQINDKHIKNRQYKTVNDKIIKIANQEQDKTYVVPIEDLNDLLSQDFKPQGNSSGEVI